MEIFIARFVLPVFTMIVLTLGNERHILFPPAMNVIHMDKTVLLE